MLFLRGGGQRFCVDLLRILRMIIYLVPGRAVITYIPRRTRTRDAHYMVIISISIPE